MSCLDHELIEKADISEKGFNKHMLENIGFGEICLDKIDDETLFNLI